LHATIGRGRFGCLLLRQQRNAASYKQCTRPE
jgi:hypothetical protein